MNAIEISRRMAATQPDETPGPTIHEYSVIIAEQNKRIAALLDALSFIAADAPLEFEDARRIARNAIAGRTLV